MSNTNNQTNETQNESYKIRIKGIIEGLQIALDQVEVRDLKTWNMILEVKKSYQKYLNQEVGTN